MSGYHLTEFAGPNGTVHRSGDVHQISGGGAFTSMIVIGFNADGYAKCARPYMYAHCYGGAPSPLIGVEPIDMVSLATLDAWPLLQSGKTIGRDAT